MPVRYPSEADDWAPLREAFDRFFNQVAHGVFGGVVAGQMDEEERVRRGDDEK